MAKLKARSVRDRDEEKEESAEERGEEITVTLGIKERDVKEYSLLAGKKKKELRRQLVAAMRKMREEGFRGRVRLDIAGELKEEFKCDDEVTDVQNFIDKMKVKDEKDSKKKKDKKSTGITPFMRKNNKILNSLTKCRTPTATAIPMF